MSLSPKTYHPKPIAGFSLIELLIVIAIVTIIGVAGMGNYVGLRSKQVLRGQTERIVADLRATAERSRSQEDGVQWGVRFWNPSGNDNDYYEVWSGSSYASSTIAERVNISDGLQLTDPSAGASKDAIFLKMTGLPTASSTIVVESSSSNQSATITIDVGGRIEYTY